MNNLFAIIGYVEYVKTFCVWDGDKHGTEGSES
jgi:hypothetical protein